MSEFHRPPRLPSRILSRFLPDADKIYLGGDFDEIYSQIRERSSPASADSWYWIQLARWIPLILSHSIIWSWTMLRNYLKITLRNLARQKGYAMINLAGLSVGIACALLIFLVVRYEFRYESHHENAEQIYRINVEHRRPDQSYMYTSTPVPLTEALDAALPEVIAFTRFVDSSQALLAHEDRKFYESVTFADSGALEMFTFPLTAGVRDSALTEADTVVMTEEMARKYFGGTDPIGKVLLLDNAVSLRVTGVMESLPHSSNLRPDFLISFETIRHLASDSYFQNWLSQQVKSFIMLPEGYSTGEAETRMQDVFRRHIPEDDDRILHLDQLRRMHLFSAAAPTGNVHSLYILLAVGGLILLVAAFNFMNLSTARSARRAREVGLRKVVGAARSQLIRQFLGESLTYTAVSLGLAFILGLLFRPVLNGLTGQFVEAGDFASWEILAGMAAVFLLVGFLSGSYPALFLSAFRPAGVLRGGEGGTRGALFRKVLVVGQFAISIFLLIATMIFGRQLHFLLNKPLGFAKDQVVVIRNGRDNSEADLQPLKTALLQNPRIRGVAGSLQLPGSIGMYNEVTWEGAVNDEIIEIIHNRVDHDFLDTFEIELLAGRNFSLEFPSDVRHVRSEVDGTYLPRSIIINQEAARRFGWEDPIGKRVIQTFGTNRIPYTVVGLIKDFHFYSLREAIKPLKLFLSATQNRYVSVKIRPEAVRETLAFIESTWNRVFPDTPFDYFFYDQYFERRYSAEASQRRLFTYFSGLAVFIGCLGLLGLAAYAAERRSKEIGIRKVMGASSPGIVWLFSRDFSRWVLAANLIAWPAAYFAMRAWLNGFAYRIDIDRQLVFFILAGAAALGIALLTVSLQAVRAARADPVASLKYE